MADPVDLESFNSFTKEQLITWILNNLSPEEVWACINKDTLSAGEALAAEKKILFKEVQGLKLAAHARAAEILRMIGARVKPPSLTTDQLVSACTQVNIGPVERRGKDILFRGKKVEPELLFRACVLHPEVQKLAAAEAVHGLYLLGEPTGEGPNIILPQTLENVLKACSGTNYVILGVRPSRAGKPYWVMWYNEKTKRWFPPYAASAEELTSSDECGSPDQVGVPPKLPLSQIDMSKFDPKLDILFGTEIFVASGEKSYEEPEVAIAKSLLSGNDDLAQALALSLNISTEEAQFQAALQKSLEEQKPAAVRTVDLYIKYKGTTLFVAAADLRRPPDRRFLAFEWANGRWSPYWWSVEDLEKYAKPLPKDANPILRPDFGKGVLDALGRSNTITLAELQGGEGLKILEERRSFVVPRTVYGDDSRVTDAGAAGQDNAFGAVQRLCAKKDLYCVAYRPNKGRKKKNKGKFLTFEFSGSDWKRRGNGKPKALWKSMDQLHKSGMGYRKKKRSKKALRNFFSFKNVYLDQESEFDSSNDYALPPLRPSSFGTGLQLYPLGKGALYRGKHKGVSSNYSEQTMIDDGLWAPPFEKLPRTKVPLISEFGRGAPNELHPVKGWGGGSFLEFTNPRSPLYGGTFPTGVYGMGGATSPRNDGISPMVGSPPELFQQQQNPLLPWGGARAPSNRGGCPRG